MQYPELAKVTAIAARKMEIEALKIWEPSEIHLSNTTGYILAFADNTGANPSIPPSDIVAKIRKQLTLEDDSTVGWYTIR